MTMLDNTTDLMSPFNVALDITLMRIIIVGACIYLGEDPDLLKRVGQNEIGLPCSEYCYCFNY